MTDYSVMGMTALMPGIQSSIDQLEEFKTAQVANIQASIDQLKTFKADLQAKIAAVRAGEANGGAQVSAREFIVTGDFIREFAEPGKKKRGRPKADAVATAAAEEAQKEFARKSKATKGYWAKLTPEERTAEMQRRGAVAKARRAGDNVDVSKLHPRDARSPRHAEYVKKLRKGQLNFWNNLSEEERVKRVNQMQNGRAA